MYFMLRDTVLNFLSSSQSPDEETVETIENVYSIPQGPLDARRIICEMILQLEKMGKLKINRPKGKCLGCGEETPMGVLYCTNCTEEQTKDLRFKISAATPPPISNQPIPAEAPKSGMHVKKD